MKNKKQIVIILRWIARIWGSLCLLLGIIFIAEMVEHLSGESQFSTNFIASLFFPGVSLIGLGIAWKWEGLGGLITIAGIIIHQIISPSLPKFTGQLLFAIPGLLFLLYWFLSRGQLETN